ncbi:YkuS family protein [Heyndrickxia acidiproducens]|uniref:YkuS family protein n=1 Tax=Heyndrickxia acidiproducens TaxID=1121084 RepID=UPI000370512E|nr:YkuS family protein [Heyndrickxia acidiproducens]
MAKIGVEQSLTDVQDALAEKGYQVVPLQTEQDVKNCDCCVVTGLDSDVMGIENTETEGSVIEASGLSADEICRIVEKRLQ